MTQDYKGWSIYHSQSSYGSESWARKKDHETIETDEGLLALRRMIDAAEGTPAEAPKPEMVKITYKGIKYEINCRETQQERMYRSEREAFSGVQDDLPERSLEAAQRYADHVVKSATWARLRKQHGRLAAWSEIPAIKVERAPKGAGALAFPGQGRIRVPEAMTNKHVMLHELAHILVGPSIGHHWPFCRAFADLVSVFMGKEHKLKLHKAFRKHGVRASPPRVMTEEQKRILSERGMAALAAWKAKKLEAVAQPAPKKEEPS